jgi:hypothetical protein
VTDFFTKVLTDKPDSEVKGHSRQRSADMTDKPLSAALARPAAAPLMANVPPDESQLVMDVARLFLSCLHAWGLDPALDQMAMGKLGLLSPKQPITYGVASRGSYMCLLLPGWWRRGQTAELTEASHATASACVSHWHISSSLTTQHLLAIIAVTNTLMRMSNATFLSSASSRRKVMAKSGSTSTR